MIIFVSQKQHFNEDYHETYDVLDRRWLFFLSCCEIVPILIPNHKALVEKYINMSLGKGILLTGGSESAEREEVETMLLEYAIKNSIPVIGVCHGMQLIQRYFGAELEAVEGHVSERQEVLIHGTWGQVNSYHQYGTRKKHPDFDVWAISKDYVVKAIKHKKYNISGMMWHPERLQPFNKRDLLFFEKTFRNSVSHANYTEFLP